MLYKYEACKVKEIYKENLEQFLLQHQPSFILSCWARNVRKWSDWSLSERKKQLVEWWYESTIFTALVKTVTIQVNWSLHRSHGGEEHNKKLFVICNSVGLWSKELISSFFLLQLVSIRWLMGRNIYHVHFCQ